ncbi:MAG TPA: glycosyltransferase family 4 protein [Longimicrobiales bacterium]
MNRTIPLGSIQAVGAARGAGTVRRRRLLFLSMYDPHVPMTGAGTRGGEFVNHLARRFDLDLLYLDGSGQPPAPALADRFAGRLTGLRSRTRIPFRRFDYFVFSRRLYREARRLMRRHRYDVVVCDYGLSAIYGLMLQREFGVPFIYSSHNVEYLVQTDKARRDKRRWLLAPYVYLVERLAVRHARLVVAISAEDARHYGRWTSSEKIVVIPQGVDVAVFNPYYDPPSNDPKIVLFCGNYNIQFNRDAVNVVMEQILAPVLARRPRTLFRFVGLGPPPAIRHPNVEFTGFVEDYPALLKAADVFISPVQQGRGFPTKIIEALACGKPVIATPVAARAIPRDFERLRVHTLEEFPDAICRALDEGRPVATGDFAKVREHYSWATNIGRLGDWIEAGGVLAG